MQCFLCVFFQQILSIDVTTSQYFLFVFCFLFVFLDSNCDLSSLGLRSLLILTLNFKLLGIFASDKNDEGKNKQTKTKKQMIKRKEKVIIYESSMCFSMECA